MGTRRVLARAPERLAVHLGLAFILLAALVWTALEAWAGKGRPTQTGRWPLIASAMAAGVFAQILLGALVAGNHAGLVYNDWPLFNGRLLPSDPVSGGLVHNLLHSPGTVQLDHRLGAYLLLAAAVAIYVAARRSHVLGQGARALAAVLAGLVTAQAALGITTLMMITPLPLAMAHQILAAVVLAVAVAFAWQVRRA